MDNRDLLDGDTAPGGVRAVLQRAVDPHTGSIPRTSARARATARSLLVFALVFTAAYIAFYIVVGASGVVPLVVINAASVLAYGGLLWLLHAGRQLAASVGTLLVGGLQITFVTMLLTADLGLHMLLLATAQLVFLLFTDAQVAYRWAAVIWSIACFAVCHFVFGERAGMPVLTAGALDLLFSINVGALGLMLVVLAAVFHVRSGDAQSEVRASAARAEHLANTDALTGLANRRPVMEALSAVATPAPREYSVAIADLDLFKELNDAFGHTCGDNVLADLGMFLRGHVRSGDIVGRWGGEEFVFVMPDTPLSEATSLVERLRSLVERREVPCGRHTHRVTASFGVSHGTGDTHAQPVIKRADDAMYDAKSAGRNIVRVRRDGDSTSRPVGSTR